MKIALFFSLLFASLLQAQTTQPTSALPMTKQYPLYWTTDINRPSTPIPPGFIPMMNDGGGRYDGDPATPGHQEKSFWIGGYYGVGGTPAAPAVPAKRWQEFDPAAVKDFANWIPRGGFLYGMDIEHWQLDIRTATNAQVQASLDKLNKLYDILNTTRPDVVHTFYSGVPAGEYWAMDRYMLSVRAYEKWKRGEVLTTPPAENAEVWAIGGCFTKLPSGYYKFNPNAAWSKNMQAWIDASARMTYNTDAQGKKLKTLSFASRLRVWSPSLYKFYPGDPNKVDEPQIMWQIGLAKRLSDGKKLIIPYVWNKMHTPETPLLSLEDFRAYIRLVFKHGADGVIAWDIAEAEYLTIIREEAEFASRQPATYFTNWKNLPWPDTFVN